MPRPLAKDGDGAALEKGPARAAVVKTGKLYGVQGQAGEWERKLPPTARWDPRVDR